MHQHSSAQPNSIHYTLEEIAEGVFACISTDGGGAMGNAGIIDLGDRTIIFDTFETPIAAEDLRVASEFLTGRPATWVVNSHSHPDHWFGNQVFSRESIVITSQITAELMDEYVEEVQDEKSDPSELAEFLQNQIKQLDVETDPIKKRGLKSAVARWKFYLESLPILNPRLPDQTFTGKITIYGSLRNVELIDVGPAHTPGDTYLTIPSDNIIFLGDIGFFEQLPYMADCDPDGWISILGELINSKYHIFIPGHGPVGGAPDLVILGEFISMLRKNVENALDQGITFDEVLNKRFPEPYRTWSVGSARSEVNTKFMFEFFSRNQQR
jgi:glyoxylase-like metal-dependent hydrolase (beta-lactamase superfamily II)